MFDSVHLIRKAGGALAPTRDFAKDVAEKVIRFHESFPEYAVTPLRRLTHLADMLGVGEIFVKDESYRFGLNAFKVLGSSYAIGRYIADRMEWDEREMTYDRLVSDEVRRRLGGVTFVTATDGNHGRGVAWTANRLKQKSVVYMPRGTVAERLQNIRALGSFAEITDLTYDDAVRKAADDAQKNGWVLIQDTAGTGSAEVPKRIMQGYTTLALEADRQMNGISPTHIFLQAGVGAMAGAIAGYFADRCAGANRPVVTVVEPETADCLRMSAAAGEARFVNGEMHTIMAGLACGEPCVIAWDILRDHADHFVSMPDSAAAKGMRVLGNPLRGDDRIVSGESGASTAGFVVEVMTNPALSDLREKIGLDRNSRILLISTEGDTDRENYRRVVWDGKYPS